MHLVHHSVCNSVAQSSLQQCITVPMTSEIENRRLAGEAVVSAVCSAEAMRKPIPYTGQPDIICYISPKDCTISHIQQIQHQ